MSEQRDKAFVRASIDQGLSSLEGNPFLAQRVLAQANGKDEIVVKKKISVSFVLVMMLLFLMASAALAAGFGLFGQLSSGDHADERLPELEQVAEVLESTMTTNDGVVIEICQAYYEGDRVFVSYRLTGNTESAVLHEGVPDRDDIVWDFEEEMICSETWTSDRPEVQRANEWLDGKSPRWAEVHVVGIDDGIYLDDDTYLDIINGEDQYQPDGTIVGWKECVIPKDSQADQLTFKIPLRRGYSIEQQNGPTYRRSYTGSTDGAITFTLARNEHYTALKGSNSAADYQAAAALEQGQVDLKGAVTVTCPALWGTQITAMEDHGADMILSWNLYQNGVLVSNKGDEGVRCVDETTLEYQLLYPHMTNLDGLTLVPEYTRSGEHMDEALMIQTINMK